MPLFLFISFFLKTVFPSLYSAQAIFEPCRRLPRSELGAGGVPHNLCTVPRKVRSLSTLANLWCEYMRVSFNLASRDAMRIDLFFYS